MTHIAKQILWQGTIQTIPFRIEGKTDILNINKIVRPLSTINCPGTLTYTNGEDVIICTDCIDNGLAGPITYAIWDTSTNEFCHRLEYDIVIICNGTKGHISNHEYCLLVNTQ